MCELACVNIDTQISEYQMTEACINVDAQIQMTELKIAVIRSLFFYKKITGQIDLQSPNFWLISSQNSIVSDKDLQALKM